MTLTRGTMRHSPNCLNCPGDGWVWIDELGYSENCHCVDSPPGEDCIACQLACDVVI